MYVKNFSKKISIIAFLITVATLLAFYFRYFPETETIYGHFSYIPIVLGSIWWGRKGIIVAAILSILLIVFHGMFAVSLSYTINTVRITSFFLVSYIIAILSNYPYKEEIQKQIFKTSKLASIGELAAGIGHEINNPLAIILCYLQVLKKRLKKEDVFDDSIENIFNIQEESVQRIERIVGGLVSYVRPDSDVIELIKINETINETLSFMEVIYKKAGVNIIKKLTQEKLVVKGNKGKFQQVLVSLLSNFKDATDGVKDQRVTIETKREKNDLVLRFIDNGHGISEDKLSKIFNSFFTTKKAGSGTGLGLSIIKNIIESSNGSIGVRSKIGEGTTFTIKLPLHEDTF